MGYKIISPARVLIVALLWLPIVSLADSSTEPVCVHDDLMRLLCLDEPAEKIISLSPGLTELLFAAGAGERVVGTTSYSDYPEAAKDIPRIGSHNRIDMEAVLAAEPDLVVAWISGNPTEQLRRLEELGIDVFWGEQRSFEDVAHTLERFGRLAGSEDIAHPKAAHFKTEIAALKARYADAAPVRLFYQIWDDPLMTVNDEHLISRAAAVCGAKNIYGDLPRLTPRLDVESVLSKDPEAIVVAGMGEDDDSWLDPWRRFEGMTAVKRNNLYFIPPSSIQRATPRLLEGMKRLCAHMEQARERR